ncbi:MAG: AbrB/MazE/SpoVT family DNA-binding domain-containing protein [Bacteroidota bacterium]
MDISTVKSKGQVVIPARIRRKHHLRRGTKVAFIEQSGTLVIQRFDKTYFDNLAGILGTKEELLESLMESKKR